MLEEQLLQCDAPPVVGGVRLVVTRKPCTFDRYPGEQALRPRIGKNLGIELEIGSRLAASSDWSRGDAHLAAERDLAALEQRASPALGHEEQHEVR